MNLLFIMVNRLSRLEAGVKMRTKSDCIVSHSNGFPGKQFEKQFECETENNVFCKNRFFQKLVVQFNFLTNNWDEPVQLKSFSQMSD